ncbi:hypothetical protein CFP56_020564 [Quercus suber]|uniref:Uncharacterized protein n=1 Tax=Quercus suber TaxID=58331 RepID=A0AAW0KHI4_QUESU
MLSLFERRYYVMEINYNNYTIRMVHSGIQKDNYSSSPSYSLNVLSLCTFPSFLNSCISPLSQTLHVLKFYNKNLYQLM